MTNILLISEDYIKTHSNLNDNVWGEYLLPAIREAQDMGLQTIIGECLYTTILDMVDDGSITATTNAAYKVLTDDYIRPYLMYKAISDLVPIIGVKLSNIGTVISNDEHLSNISESERERLRQYYEYRSDFYCKRLQEFLLNNKAAYPELKECDCNRLKTNLHSTASVGLFLGGMRGRKLK